MNCLPLARVVSKSFRATSVYAIAFVVWACGTARAAEHFIHISVDGMNARLLQQLIDSGNAPNIKRFQDEGVWTTNARTDYTFTNTLPNHTCMVTGRPVEQPAGMPATVHHGWRINYVPRRSSTLHKEGNPAAGYIASVFDVVHDAGLTTALYAGKSKFAIYDQTYNEDNGAENARGRDKIDEFFTHDDDPPLMSATINERFLADMATYHFNYVFVHYKDADTLGHDSGWGCCAWFYALRNIDRNIGRVLRLVETDPELTGRTAIILTTDHGGFGYEHSTATFRENYTIPLMVWGAGVGHGELYALNRGVRTDPGESRPDYNAPEQPIRNGDAGNLALSLLGLGPIPGSLINAKQDLRVDADADFNHDGSVDAADYVLLRKAESSPGDLQADMNGDGRVDEADHKLWQAKFGKSPKNVNSSATAQ